MSSSLFPCLFFSGLRVEWAEEEERHGRVISVPPELYVQGCVKDVDEGLAVSFHFRIGYGIQTVTSVLTVLILFAVNFVFSCF